MTYNPQLPDIPIDIERKIFPSEQTFLGGYRGSIAHGMYVPNTDPNSIDDIDLFSIVIPSLDHYFGLKTYGSRGTKEIFEGRFDCVIYEFTKVIHLLTKANPNVLCYLWMEPKHYLRISPFSTDLFFARERFLTKKIYFAIEGYAKSQMELMTRGIYKGYMGEKRKALVDKYGFDPKSASHMIRLLKLGITALRHGYIEVYRKEDREELLAIKRGEIEFSQIKEDAQLLFVDLKDAFRISILPEEPNMEDINNLCVNIMKKHFKAKQYGKDFMPIGK